jgi:hypothetical protein
MKINVGRIVEGKFFDIVGISYIGAPRSNTAMFISKKVEHLLVTLENVDKCLIFAEHKTKIPSFLAEKHAFHFS